MPEVDQEKMQDLFESLCNKIEQPWAADFDSAEPGDWYLSFGYTITGIYERAENLSDLKLTLPNKNFTAMIAFAMECLTQYNENIQ